MSIIYKQKLHFTSNDRNDSIMDATMNVLIIPGIMPTKMNVWLSVYQCVCNYTYLNTFVSFINISVCCLTFPAPWNVDDLMLSLFILLLSMCIYNILLFCENSQKGVNNYVLFILCIHLFIQKWLCVYQVGSQTQYCCCQFCNYFNGINGYLIR